MLDRFRREISYLRISVTDRCNLACDYCTNGDNAGFIPRDDILSFEEIAHVVTVGTKYGIRKIRLTGGEPLLRKDLYKLISVLSRIQGIEDISLTTNGTLLAGQAEDLAKAGLDRANVSIDTLDRKRFAEITGMDRLAEVLRGIETARSCGLAPIKLNCVIDNTPDEIDAKTVAEFAQKNGYAVRFIKRMNLSNGTFSKVRGGTGGDCPACDRLRLTSDGRIIPCLMSDLSFSVKELGIEEAFVQAIAQKPRSGEGSVSHTIRVVGG